MVKVENIEVFGFESAIRGMRNPLNSWARSDSYMSYDCSKCGKIYEGVGCEPKKHDCSEYYGIQIGPNDLGLMKKLYNAGPEHRKYLRQIFVWMDITAPLYWWKEFDTYKIGTTANSCSTMHKIAEYKFTRTDFSCEHLFSDNYEQYNDGENECYIDHVGYYEDMLDGVSGFYPMDALDVVIDMLNKCREVYLKTKNKEVWWQMIQLLPSSYNQRRTVCMNYEVVMRMIDQRTGHKLDEWNEFVDILKALPYVREIREEVRNDVG